MAKPKGHVTVKQLIEKLQKMPQDAYVVGDVDDGCINFIKAIGTVWVWPEKSYFSDYNWTPNVKDAPRSAIRAVYVGGWDFVD